MDTARHPALVAIAVLAGFVLLAYLPGLHAPFAYDDKPNILLHPGAHADSWSELGAAASHPSRQDRPVARLTFGLNYLTTGLDPAGFRWVNIAIHVAAAFVLYLLVVQLAQSPNAGHRVTANRHALAIAAALLWALEPVHTQAVTYIVQRMTSLAALFYLGVLATFVTWRLGRLRARWALPLMSGLWLAALGSKMHAVTVPAALVVLEIAFFTGWTRRNLVIGGGVLIAGLCGVAAFFFHYPSYIVEDAPRGFSVLDRLLSEPRVLWHYFSLLVWPDADRLRVNYELTASQGLVSPWTTLPALLALAAATAAALVYLRRYPWLAAGWLFWLVAHSVESSVILLALAFEHRIYLPSTLLVAGAVATVFGAWPSRWPRWVLNVAVLALAAGLAQQTVERNRDWADLERLWGHDVAKGADPAGIGRNAALAALGKGEPERALRILEGVRADMPKAQNKVEMIRAEALLLMGELERAERKLQSILSTYERARKPHYLYVRVLLRQGRIGDAHDMVVRMRTFLPDSAYTAMAEAEVMRRRGRPDEAIAHLRAWLDAHDGASATARNNVRLHLAHALATSGRGEEAAGVYRAIVRSNPQAWNAWRGLIRVLEAGGSTEQAREIRDYLRKRGVNPDVGRGSPSAGAAPMSRRRGPPDLGEPPAPLASRYAAA